MPEIFVHPWFDQDPANPFEPMPFPNTPQAESIDDRILSHMTNRLSFSASAVVSAVVGNKACGASSTYYLLSKRLARYVKQHPESVRKRRGLVRQQRRRSTLALEGIEGINEDELLETVPLPSSGINGWPRDEKSFETQVSNHGNILLLYGCYYIDIIFLMFLVWPAKVKTLNFWLHTTSI